MITDRGRPVAVLEPIGAADVPDAVVEYLIASGQARAPTRSLGADFFTQRRAADPSARVLNALLEERRTSR